MTTGTASDLEAGFRRDGNRLAREQALPAPEQPTIGSIPAAGTGAATVPEARRAAARSSQAQDSNPADTLPGPGSRQGRMAGNKREEGLLPADSDAGTTSSILP